MYNNQQVYDLAIIGSGPGGYTAALSAAKRGARICLIEKDELGGVCLNQGCIPTKTIMRSAEIYDLVKKADQFGIEVKNSFVNLQKVIRRKDDVITHLKTGLSQLIKGHGISYIKAQAEIIDKNKIRLSNNNEASPTVIEAKNIIIATGSTDIIIPTCLVDHEYILDVSDILKLNSSLPKRATFIGGGVIGVEWACIFNNLDVEVSIIEVQPTLLPKIDEQISRLLRSLMQKKGIKIYLNSKVVNIEKDKEITVVLENGMRLATDKVFLTIGKRPATINLEYQSLGIGVNPGGGITVNEKMETSIEGIYAIGDVVGNWMLAHIASEQGIVAAHNALKMGIPVDMDYTAIPTCIFSSPEISFVGLTENQAKKQGHTVKIGRFNFCSLGKAFCSSELDGFVKIISDQDTYQILGGQIIGPKATELISGLTLAIKNKMKVHDVISTVHSHPTFSEVIQEAARDTYKEAVHRCYFQQG
ncbi:MAG: dihydrolipoyl dehydrogenase [bacterium]